MKKRIITSIVSLAIFVPFLVFSLTFLFPCAIALLSAVSIYELSACTGMKKNYPLTVPFYLIAVVLPFVFRYYFHPVYVFIAILFGIFVGVLYCFCNSIFSREKYNLGDTFVFFSVSLLVLAGLNSILFVRGYFFVGRKILFLLPFLGAWVTDSFAYFTGLLFGKNGKHKLIPDVSPKKTVEGAIGGCVFCILFTVLFLFIANKCGEYTLFGDNYLLAGAVGLLMSVFAQLGDLSMSVLKRHYGIKDFGKVFPGHGGVMDRFDSVISTAIFFLIFCFAYTYI